VVGPPHFWPRGGFGHPIPAVWGWPKPPQAFGGGPATPKGPKKKKKRGKNGFWPLGVAGPPPRAWRWPKPPPTAGRGCPKPPPGPRRWSGHPQRPKPISPPPPFFLGPFGVAGPPPKAWGGFGHPHTAGMGWPKPPLGQKWGGSATPLLGRGWLQPPRFPLLFFYFLFLFFFNFLLFFKKKKKKKPKMQNYAVLPKTASFWTSPKRRSFGVEGIMGIYKYLYTHYTLEGS
jgi:hypothetical protein